VSEHRNGPNSSVGSAYAREKRKSDQAGLVRHTKHMGDYCRGLTAHRASQHTEETELGPMCPVLPAVAALGEASTTRTALMASVYHRTHRRGGVRALG
jgi:hypothetical protein